MKLTAAACFCFLLTSVSALSQKEPRFTLFLNSEALRQNAPLPFGALKVIDARFDQDAIGCVARTLSFKGITQQKTIAIFPGGLKSYLPALLVQANYFNQTRTDTLVMLIKQWRIADHVRPTMEKRAEAESILSLSCSFFLAKSNQLVKLFSLDDLMVESWQADEEADETTVSQQRSAAVARLIQKVFADRLWQPSTTVFSIADVAEGLNKRFQLPLYTDTLLIAGVYKTFAEFKANRPSIFNVLVGRNHDGSIKEIRDAGGNLIDIRSIWGLCDGQYRYVSFQGGLQPLMAVGKNFRFVFYRRRPDANQAQDQTYYYQSYAQLAAGVLYPGNLAKGFEKEFRPEYLYLNLENGTVHTEEIIGAGPSRKLRTKSE